jgi:hypothetical protein
MMQMDQAEIVVRPEKAMVTKTVTKRTEKRFSSTRDGRPVAAVVVFFICRL